MFSSVLTVLPLLFFSYFVSSPLIMYTTFHLFSLINCILHFHLTPPRSQFVVGFSYCLRCCVVWVVLWFYDTLCDLCSMASISTHLFLTICELSFYYCYYYFLRYFCFPRLSLSILRCAYATGYGCFEYIRFSGSIINMNHSLIWKTHFRVASGHLLGR